MNGFVAIDWTWLLLGLPLAFGLGWFASRLDITHWRLESRHRPNAYFKGLNHLLNGQQDAAVDAFIEAVQNDPDTAELHFTLGALFRRRGEYDCATRVHGHLIARADLSDADRARARFALAQDYWKAGVLDRAEQALAGLETPEALHLRLSLLERGRQWQSAMAVAEVIEEQGLGHMDQRIAHHWCELGRYDEAIARAPHLARPYIAKAKANPAAAFANYTQLLEKAPQAAPLIASEVLATAPDAAHQATAAKALQAIYEESQDLDVLRALIAHGHAQPESALRAHLQKRDSLGAAALLCNDGQVRAVLERLAKKEQRYRCAGCGFEAHQYFWQCPGCQVWGSFSTQKLESL